MIARVAAATLFVLSSAGIASAHGGFFRVHEILFGPDDPDFIVLRSDVWGTAVSQDGGDSWHWLCAEAYGRDSTTGRRISMLIAEGNRILVASLGDGLFVSDADPCQWEPLPQFEDELVRDLERLEDGRLIALSSRSTDQGTRSQLWVSEDAGNTWSELGVPLPDNLSGISLGVAASDTQRIYVAAKGVETVRMAVTSDAGQSWQEHSFAFAVDALTFEPRVAAVDPSNPDTVYLLIDATSGMGNQDAPDSVLVSTDGGMNFATVLESPSDLPALVLSPDGEQIAIGGIEAGLLVGSAASAAAAESDALVQRWPGQIYGLRWTSEGLYAGGDDWSMEPRFGLGLSSDDGESFAPAFSVCELTALSCDTNTRAGLQCPPRFSDMGENGGAFKEDFLDSSRCQETMATEDAGSTSSDAGMTEDAATASVDGATASVDGATGTPAMPRDASQGNTSGCSCRTAAAPHGDGLAILLACACVFARRRRLHVLLQRRGRA